MIRIVTDSGANLPDELAEEHNIARVPLQVHFGEHSYREGVDLSNEQFFEMLPSADPLPKTSQPSPMEFEEVFRPIVEQGDEVVAVVLSSKLSGTYNSAYNAALTLEGHPISVVDSKSASAGISVLLLAAVSMIEAGLGREEIASRLETLADEVRLILTLDTLEYLRRGGRIGGARAFLGGLLRVKPIIMLKDGVIEPGGRARSQSKAIEQIIELERGYFGDEPVWVASAQAVAPSVAQLEALARERLNVQKMIRCDVGPVVGTHTGPGVVGLAVMPAPQL